MTKGKTTNFSSVILLLRVPAEKQDNLKKKNYFYRHENNMGKIKRILANYHSELILTYNNSLWLSSLSVVISLYRLNQEPKQ